MRSRKVLSIVVALACLSAAPALAQTNYPDFSSTAGLTLNGAAATLNNGIDPAPVLRLATTAVFNGGSAFTTQRVCLGSFSSSFTFRITGPAGLPDASGQAGADGLTLVFQGAGPSALGVLGGSLGYGGIAPSVAVEIDTWDNGAIDAGTNHVGIDVNGSLNSLAKAAVPGRFDDGTLWSAWVDYNGTTLEVRVSNTGVRPAAANVSLAIDLPATLGSSAGFAGFTAATGAAWGNHDVASWTLDGRCANITIEACGTGVEDFFASGNTLFSEQIRACAIAATSHGKWVSCVAALTNAANKSGAITGKQKGAIQSCAARAPYYTGPVKTGDFIVNGDFETGDASGWTLTPNSGRFTINDGTFVPFAGAATSPINGAFDLLSDTTFVNLSHAAQGFTVPLEVHSATLAWSDRVRSFAALADPTQEYRVVIRAAGSLALLAEVFSTNPGDPAVQLGPNLRSADLTATLQALKGQPVVIRFEHQVTASFFNLNLDDVSLVLTYR
jgi:hypothetical protein